MKRITARLFILAMVIAGLVSTLSTFTYLVTDIPEERYNFRTGQIEARRFTWIGVNVYSPFQDANGYIHSTCKIPALSFYTAYDPQNLVAVAGRIGWESVSYGKSCSGYVER